RRCGTALGLLVIAGAVLWALSNNHSRDASPGELYSTDHHDVADRLTTLPQDYAGIPRDVLRLGPPLSGDFGRPIGVSHSAPISPDEKQQRANQESEAALTSKVFALTTSPTSQRAPSPEPPANTTVSSDASFAQNGQDRKLLFVNASVDRRTT